MGSSPAGLQGRLATVAAQQNWRPKSQTRPSPTEPGHHDVQQHDVRGVALPQALLQEGGELVQTVWEELSSRACFGGTASRHALQLSTQLQACDSWPPPLRQIPSIQGACAGLLPCVTHVHWMQRQAHASRASSV